MHIILVDASQAKQLGEALVHHASLTGLRVCIEGDSVKFKINQGGWSPPMGRLDPLSDEAHERFRAAKETFKNDVREDGA